MPVNSQHPDYTARIGQWTRCSDVIEGSDAVKAAGEAYLPRLEGQAKSNQSDEYEAYKMRALFYNATSRTVDGLTGLVFRKDPEVDLPLSEEETKLLLTDITQSGMTFMSYAKHIIRCLLAHGRVGLLVDRAPEVAGQTVSAPFLAAYDARDIVNWQSKRIEDGQIRPSRIVLREMATEPNPKDPFVMDRIVQYRELFLNDGGVYEVRLWREKDSTAAGGSSEWIVTETYIPSNRGTPFTFLPFIIANISSMSMGVEKSPLLDLIDVNLSHYRSSADLEHGRHYTALPTPWVAGFDPGTVLRIGSATAWVTENEGASAGILEFTGAGLSECRNALLDKQTMMAVLGARLLEEQKSAVEAADTIKTRMSGEQSIMRSMVATASQALTLAMNWLLTWNGGTGETVRVELNKDFIDSRLDPTEQASLMAALQAGTISFETYYWNMERGEMTRPNVDAEEEMALIEQQRASLVAFEQAMAVAAEPEEDEDE